MEYGLILSGKATLEDLYRLHELGYEFVINNGEITEIRQIAENER